MATLSEAIERSTYAVDLSFSDEDGTAMVPDSLTWSLRNSAGAIINARSSVATVVGTTVTIVLSGADLSYEPSVGSSRVLTIEATYTSSLGAGLPLKDEYTIPIRDLQGV
jgi:hypothetical protein